MHSEITAHKSDSTNSLKTDRYWRVGDLEFIVGPRAKLLISRITGHFRPYYGETMTILENIRENLGALIVATIAAVFGAFIAWLSTIFIGVKFFRDEWSYGIPLAFGIPAALVGGVAAFLISFRKLR